MPNKRHQSTEGNRKSYIYRYTTWMPRPSGLAVGEDCEAWRELLDNTWWQTLADQLSHHACHKHIALYIHVTVYTVQKTTNLSSHSTCSPMLAAVTHGHSRCPLSVSDHVTMHPWQFYNRWPWPVTFWPPGQWSPNDYHRVYVYRARCWQLKSFSS